MVVFGTFVLARQANPSIAQKAPTWAMNAQGTIYKRTVRARAIASRSARKKRGMS